MNKERLIQKWLDHDLNPQELEVFKKLEDYDELVALDSHLKELKTDTFDTEMALESVKTIIKSKTKKPRRLAPFFI